MEATEYIRLGNSLQTTNLVDRGQANIRVQFESETLFSEAKLLLDTLEQYVSSAGARLLDQETMAYGFWQIQFRSLQSNLLNVWERTSEGDSFQPGASLALTFWQQQNELCKAAGLAFEPAHAGMLVAVTPGALEGRTPIRGERHEAQHETSGWYVYSSDFLGKAEDFQVLHLYHLARRVPRVTKFLALPIGYGFCLTDEEKILRIDTVADS